MFGLSGSWGLMLAKNVLDRVDKAENVVKEMNVASDQMKVQVGNSERSHKVDAKYEKLRLEVKRVEVL